MSQALSAWQWWLLCYSRAILCWRQTHCALVMPAHLGAFLTQQQCHHHQCLPGSADVESWSLGSVRHPGEHWTHDWKVPGSRQEWWENFLLQGQLSVLLFWYSFHPCVTTVACKRSWSFCRKCRWQVTAKHTYMALNEVTLSTGARLNGVHRTCTETATFHVAPATQQPKSTTSTPLPWILKICAIKKKGRYSHSFRITCHMCAVSLLKSRE